MSSPDYCLLSSAAINRRGLAVEALARCFPRPAVAGDLGENFPGRAAHPGGTAAAKPYPAPRQNPLFSKTFLSWNTY